MIQHFTRLHVFILPIWHCFVLHMNSTAHPAGTTLDCSTASSRLLFSEHLTVALVKKMILQGQQHAASCVKCSVRFTYIFSLVIPTGCSRQENILPHPKIQKKKKSIIWHWSERKCEVAVFETHHFLCFYVYTSWKVLYFTTSATPQNHCSGWIGILWTWFPVTKVHVLKDSGLIKKKLDEK